MAESGAPAVDEPQAQEDQDHEGWFDIQGWRTAHLIRGRHRAPSWTACGRRIWTGMRPAARSLARCRQCERRGVVSRG